jgi:hypothetical protein
VVNSPGEADILNAREAILRKPWLLPFIAVILKGAERPGEISDILGCSRKLASTGLYILKRMSVDIDTVDFCIVKWRRWFATRIGSIIIVSKVGKRRVKAYTVPALLLEERVGGKLGYRARIALLVLEKGEEYAGCESGR